ncbi:MAG: hypothetical protein GQ579_01445, partial [Bacteroidales bacterium]|nr:hypothetical protein [Bacteroidales bacterium]
MKKFLLPGLLSLTLLLLTINMNAQAPTILWNNLYPSTAPVEDHMSNMIMEDPYGGIVIVGNKRFPSQTNPYHEVLVIRLNKDGYPIWIKSFGGTKTYNDVEYPWTQEANDMVMTPEGNYLITGYRDTTSYNMDSPPGVFLLEISPAGQVITDTLYYNRNNDQLVGHSIRPAPGGGYIIAGKIREEDAGRDDIMMISLKKDEHGEYNNIGLNLIQVNKVNEVATTGYATWVRPFGDGYLLAGQCRDDGDQMFLQKVNDQRFPEWTYYYGNNAWFSDGVIMGDTIYLAGYMAAPVDGSTYDKTQAYIVKIDHEGTVIWERTYGGNRTVYSMAIDALVDGNLMIAAMPMRTPSNAEIALLKVDAVTGDSLYMQSYGTFYSAG